RDDPRDPDQAHQRRGADGLQRQALRMLVTDPDLHDAHHQSDAENGDDQQRQEGHHCGHSATSPVSTPTASSSNERAVSESSASPRPVAGSQPTNDAYPPVMPLCQVIRCPEPKSWRNQFIAVALVALSSTSTSVAAVVPGAEPSIIPVR